MCAVLCWLRQVPGEQTDPPVDGGRRGVEALLWNHRTLLTSESKPSVHTGITRVGGHLTKQVALRNTQLKYTVFAL